MIKTTVLACGLLAVAGAASAEDELLVYAGAIDMKKLSELP